MTAPEHDGEGNQRRDRRDQEDRKIVDTVRGTGTVRATVDEAVDVFSNALVRIVGLTGDEADPVMVVASQPPRHEVVSQPLAPADDEHRLRKEFNDRSCHIEKSKRREDKQQLMPECRCIVVLNGIEQVAIEEVEPHNDADLSLIDQHEDSDHRHTEPPLKCCKWTEGPDVRAVDFISSKIPVGIRVIWPTVPNCATT